MMHTGLEGGDSQKLEMTNQKSVKYAEESVEMICVQWHLHQNTGGHRVASQYD